MKKIFSLTLVILSSYLFTSCTFNKAQYIKPGTKPKSNYYIEEIKNKLNENEKYTLKIFDLNLYKYYDVDSTEHSIIPEFIDDLKTENYLSEFENNKIEPQYKIIIEFSNQKYIINAYNDSLISIYPWDGVYSEDIISMEGIPDYYNLYKFCEYIKKISNGFEG